MRSRSVTGRSFDSSGVQRRPGVGVRRSSRDGHRDRELQELQPRWKRVARGNLYAAAKKPVRSVIGGQVYILKVTIFESFGEDAFAVSIELAPTLDPSIAPSFTAKQGQYLAFIYNYTKIHGQPPAESDLERYFRVSPPAIHEMIKTLERNGLIARIPGKARSIRLCVQPKYLPRLE